MLVLYLHGFASSAQSSKAAFFRSRLAAHGIDVETPDFNLPNFETLTISRMLDQVREAIAGVEDVVLIGSSLGAFVAVQAALQHPDRVRRMILLAPALDFSGNRLRDLGDRGVDEWRRTNELMVFHYAFGKMMPVHFGLYTDAERYDSFNARIDAPILVFQGSRDVSVDPETVRRWSDARPNVELHVLDDDHQLLGSLDFIWAETEKFLSLAPAPSRPPDAAHRA